MQLSNFRMFPVLMAVLVGQVKAYPMPTFPAYHHPSRDYTENDYYYAPTVQYVYDTAEDSEMPTAPYGQVSFPYYYDTYGRLPRHEERLAALPVGQETWFDRAPAASSQPGRWQGAGAGDDDVSAAFLDNLILTQMAQDAQRRRQHARAALARPRPLPADYDDREDEDVRELKALAGKPLYHAPATVPRFDDDEDDYPADEGFINWDSKRSAPAAAASTATVKPGQKEVVMPRPALHEKRTDYYDTVARLLGNKSLKPQDSTKPRRMDKRFVAMDRDLVQQLRGLKHRIAT